MFANEQDYEKYLLEDEDPYEFMSIWIGHKVFIKPTNDADKLDQMLAAGAFKEDKDAEDER